MNKVNHQLIYHFGPIHTLLAELVVVYLVISAL